MPAFLQSIFALKNYIHFITLDENNRMVRGGFGKNEGKWFARADLWFFGVRISK